MKTAGWILTVYLGVIGAATLYSAMGSNTPTSDTVATLPSAGSLLNSTGATAALLDAAGAFLAWKFLVH